jgi:S-adenosylmethionine synthetase
VACEVLSKGGDVILAGEVASRRKIDVDRVVRRAIREIGYIDPEEPFSADRVRITSLISPQSPEIAEAVAGRRKAMQPFRQGAGDQGIVFGYATDETPELMPFPLLLSHRLAHGLADDRKSGRVPWLRPDGKTQVSVLYRHGRPVQVTAVLVSAHHSAGVKRSDIVSYVKDELVPRALGGWAGRKMRLIVNPSGSFTRGGPSADCGLTGRKNIVDSYGGAARHGGGSFSGKDASKVDRSAAYFCRYVARQVVLLGIAKRVEVQVAYAIGVPEPVALSVDCFGTGDETEVLEFVMTFDFRPAAIIERLGLLRPIYRQTTNYGHFGRAGLPWEE